MCLFISLFKNNIIEGIEGKKEEEVTIKAPEEGPGMSMHEDPAGHNQANTQVS